ncbi:hypothetical protein Tco_1134909 [Tanacetum coccineum]
MYTLHSTGGLDDVPSSPGSKASYSKPEWDLLLITTNNLQIVSSGIKPPLGWLPVWESATRSPTPSRWAFDKTKAKDTLMINCLCAKPCYSRLGNSTTTQRNLQSHRSLIVPIFAQSVPKNLAENNSIVAKHGLSSKIPQSPGVSSDTSEGSKNSGSFKDSRSSYEEYSEDGASYKEGGSKTL